MNLFFTLKMNSLEIQMTLVMMKVTNASVMMTKMKMTKQVKKTTISVTMKVSNQFVKYFEVK